LPIKFIFHSEKRLSLPNSDKAQERDRTADLVLTKDVLYRLSYLGIAVDGIAWQAVCSAPRSAANPHTLSSVGQIRFGAGNGTRTRDPKLGRLALYQLSYSRSEKNGGEGRIRTFEGIAGRFTVCSLWPLGNLSLFPLHPIEKLVLH
jgi:hypothetical protein